MHRLLAGNVGNVGLRRGLIHLSCRQPVDATNQFFRTSSPNGSHHTRNSIAHIVFHSIIQFGFMYIYTYINTYVHTYYIFASVCFVQLSVDWRVRG